MKQILSALSLLLIPAVSAAGSSSDYNIGFAIVGGIFGIVIFIMILAALVSVFWIWMIIDCAVRKNFKTDSDKVAWILVLVFVGIIGAIIYYFVIKREYDKHKKRRKK